jgi:tetratricopeptide (TPR) repeat protein
LSNNTVCSWADLKAKVNKSTLSIYLKKLKSGGFIETEFNQYRITSKGRERYYQLGQSKKGGRNLSYPPKVILDKRNYDHQILWMVYNNNFCKWGDFLEEPLSINQSSLSKNMNRLMEKSFVVKEDKEYRITRLGKSEYSQMLTYYELDRQSILEEESKRISELTQKTLNFFTKFDINEREIQFRFLNSVLKLDYEKVKSVLRDEEDFHKILLFLSINHPNDYPKYMYPEEFSDKYDIKKTTLDYYIDEIVENQIFPVRFFKLEEPPDKSYYFQSDEKVEKMLRIITEEHIQKFTYLNKLFEGTSDLILPLNMSSTVNAILEEACQNLINEGLKNSLRKLLPEYINYLAYKIEKELKLEGVSSKLEGIIWQNIPQILQSDIYKTSQYQFISESEMNYYLDTSILEVLQPYLSFWFNPEELNLKIQDYLKSKEYDKALRLEELAKRFSKPESEIKNLVLIIIKGIILCHLNRNKESIEFLRSNVDFSLIKKEEDIYAPYLFVLAFSYMTLGDIENALNMANKAIEIFPKLPLSHVLRGLVLGYNLIYSFDDEKADKENGISDIDKAVSLESNNFNKARYYQLRSHILYESKNYDDALESIENAIKLNPKVLDLYNSKIRILLYLDQFDEIISILDKLIVDFPEAERNLKIKKMYIFKEKKNIEKGLDIINELIEKYPEDNSLVLHKIYWLQYLDEKEEIFNTIEDLIAKDPKMGIYHDTYGEILMNFEEYEKAIKEFQKTIELASEEWYINETYIKLGICYRELEDFDLAIEYLSKGQEFTNKRFCDLDTKNKWLAIVKLYINEIEQLEMEF